MYIDWIIPSKSQCGHLREICKTFASILKLADFTESKCSIYKAKEILRHHDLKFTQVSARLAMEFIG